MEETVAALALLAPQVKAPASLGVRVKKQATSSPSNVAALPQAKPARAWVPIGLAAAAAICAGWLGFERSRLQEQVTALTATVRNAPQVSQIAPAMPPPASVSNLAELAELRLANAKAQEALEQARKQIEQEKLNAKALAGSKDEVAVRMATLQQELDAARAEQNSAKETVRRLEARFAESTNQVKALERQLAAANSAPATPSPTTGGDGEIRLANLQRDLDVARKEADRQTRALADYRAMFRIIESSNMKQVVMKGIAPAAGGGTATALLAADGGLLLLAKNLPKLPNDRVYQLWLVKKGSSNVASAGLLKIDAQGRGVVYAGPQANLGDVTGLAISEEPLGGSPAPTGLKLLFGAV